MDAVEVVRGQSFVLMSSAPECHAPTNVHEVCTRALKEMRQQRKVHVSSLQTRIMSGITERSLLIFA